MTPSPDVMRETVLTDGLLTPAEVMARLKVSKTWLYRAAKDGRIPCVRLGGESGPVRFVEEDLDRWMDAARRAWRPGDSSQTTLRRVHDDQ